MAMMLIGLVVSIGMGILQKLFQPKPKDIYGPRISDVNVPAVSPGNPITYLWGTMKLQAQMIWCSRLIETTHVIQQSGGKGFGGNKQKEYEYTYSIHGAWMICAGPLEQVNRIWANGKMLWQNPALAGQAQATFDDAYYSELDRLINDAGVIDVDYAYAGAFIFAFNNYRPDEFTYGTQQEASDYVGQHPGRLRPADQGGPIANCPDPNGFDVYNVLGQMLSGLGQDEQYASNRVRFDEIFVYLGTDEQLPNALISSFIGPGNTPAYRGIAYFVINNLQLVDFGEAVPTFAAEVARTTDPVELRTIVADACTASGLTDDQFDHYTNIPRDVVLDGYCITQASTGRDVIQNLMKVFAFDACESGFKLVFNWINSRPVARLQRGDFGAHLDTDDMPVSEQVTRIHDWDLPRRLNLKYQEKARAFSSNTEYAMRNITLAQTVEDVDVTCALTRQVARDQVEEMLALRYTARMSYKMTLPRKYAILEPGDAVLVPSKDDDGTFYPLRLIQADIGVNGLVEATFVTHNYHVKPAAIVQGDNFDPVDQNLSQMFMPGNAPTTAYMLDLPLLRDDEDDTIGFYAVLLGGNALWAGGALMADLNDPGSVAAFGLQTQAVSSGADFYNVANNRSAGIHGYTINGLAGGKVYGMWDSESQLLVYCRNRSALIHSRSKQDLLTLGVNALQVNGEIVQFCNATSKGNDLWLLDTFLRGLRGTEDKIDGHAGGEPWCNLNSDVVDRVAHTASYLNKQGTFRCSSYNDDADKAATFTFTDTGQSLKCRPVQLRRQATYRGDDNVCHLAWLPRNRQRGGLYSGTAATVDQPVEQYQVDVFSLGWGLVPFLIETRTVGASRALDYGPADIQAGLAANGSPAYAAQSTAYGSGALAADPELRFDIYQLGHDIGRGKLRSIAL